MATDDTTFSRDENSGPALMVISSLLLGLIIITTSLRLYTRFSLRMLGWDDYTIAVTALLAVVRVAIQAVQVQHGNGRHRPFISAEDYILNNMLGWYAQILLFISTALLKISICLLLLRIRNSRRLKIFLGCVIAGLAITNLTCVIILLAECSPVEAYWMGGGVCWDTRVRIYAIYITIGYSLMTDLMCSLLPLLVIWNVQMPLKRKMMIWGLMSLGLTATSFGALRASSLGLVTDDLSWTYCIAAIWSNLELFLGINAANLALSRSIWVFLRHGRHDTNSTQATWTGRSGTGGSTSGPTGQRRGPFDTEIDVAGEAAVERDGRRSEGSDIPLEPGVQGKKDFWSHVESNPAESPGDKPPPPWGHGDR